MLENGVVYCPNCDEVLETEMVNNEWVGNCYIDSVIGKCPCCHKTYQWSEIYQFADIDDFEEITES